MKADKKGTLLFVGDVVTTDELPWLEDVVGTVVEDCGIDDYVSVQLQKKILPESAMPEILVSPASIWELQHKYRGDTA